MRVQTLVYIKEMLEKEVETREKAVKKLRGRLAEAKDALEDFLQKDWN